MISTEQPDLDEVSLLVQSGPQVGAQRFVFQNWDHYSFSSHFLSPSSSWSFSVSDDRISKELGGVLRPGLTCSLICNENTIATGRIDAVQHHYTRDSGGQWDISGRDILGQTVDSGVNPRDPKFKFKATQTLEDIVTTIFKDFGIGVVATDNDANRAFATGQERGTRFNKAKRARNIKPLKEYRLSEQLKPHDHEGAYEFAARLAKRFGLKIWLSANGTYVIVGTPDFDQEPTYAVAHLTGNTNGVHNNVLTGTANRDATDQPSYIVASGFGQGGVNDYGGARVLVFNEFLCYDNRGKPIIDFAAVKKAHTGALPIDPRPIDQWGQDAMLPVANPRPLYLHDDESRTPEQLTSYAKRELANRQRRVLTATYEFQGHTNSGSPWFTDTIARVDDDSARIHTNMYVIAVNYTKSRSQGTRTRVEMILPNTLDF